MSGPRGAGRLGRGIGRTRGGVFAAVLGIVAGTLTALAAPPAAALTPPVGFTADALSTYQTNGIVWSLAEADGVVYAGGTFSGVRPAGSPAGSNTTPAVNFAAFDAATGAPTGCSLSFTRTSGTATVRALAVSPDRSTLYAGGYFNAVSGTAANGLVAIDTATCRPRTGFAPQFGATVRALDVAADGTVYAGGDFQTVGGTSRRFFAAVTATGALTGWNPNADAPGRTLRVTPDGDSVLIGGDFFTVGSTASHALAVTGASTGAVTRAYGSGFIPSSAVIKDIVTDEASGGWYAAGEGAGGSSFDGRLAMGLDDFDQRWRDTCQGATQALRVYQGVLYAGSHVHDCSTMGGFPNQVRKHLTAQSVDGPDLLGWLPDTNDGIGEPVGPRALTVSSRGGRDFLWVGGEFTTVNGTGQQALTRFANTPDTGAPPAPAVSVSAPRAGEVRVSWRSSLDLDDSLLTYRVYRDGGSAPVYTTTGSSLFFSRPQLTFTDRNVVAGRSYSYRVTASDGTNTSALSAAASVTAASSASPYQEKVLADGADLYWRYDEAGGAFAADASASDNGGVYVNAPSYRATPSAVAGSAALSLNGTDEYVYSDRLHHHTSPAPYSVETWFRTTSTRGGRIVGFGNNIGTAAGHTSSISDKLVYLTDGGRLAFGVQSGNSRPTITSAGAYNDGAWHHAVATQGPAGMVLYVDGTAVGTNAATGNRSYNGYWRVGGDAMTGAWPNRPTSVYFAGQVDETAVYPSALTAAQVAAHHELAGTPPGPGDSTVTVTPDEDAYVNSVAANTNYNDSQLAARGTTAYLSYLRFTLPPAPAGQVLRSARLTFRTSSDSTAGSAESHDIVPVTGTWTESAVTYNTRPALSSSVLGTITGAVSVSTDYSAELDASALGGALGSVTSLALTGSGTDSLRIWSSEATAAHRPQLVLTFGVE
ncbi:Concanavalin A-like lectin/glucanases superfamily protein [Streptomyces sp. LamerLS-316]|uniref:DNRLRE domain-containing protein n=1 Tax=unclassified Streptomyces TaxID=2593676 RepID=UPI000823C252|nr:DNRLRE domain-containing protein [Streptomyces sp. LamerLS-316]MYQ36887.1 DNRLRE domain-containing protein [Streptomyces sp. SID4921]SCK51666.1 Concanavalin A-like lectin/glucanases superfamily protein [Streptomyces sp. LamerLS-316]